MDIEQFLIDWYYLPRWEFEAKYPACVEAMSCHPHAVEERDILHFLVSVAEANRAARAAP